MEMVLLVKLAMQSTYVKGSKTSGFVMKAEGYILSAETAEMLHYSPTAGPVAAAVNTCGVLHS